MDGKIADGDELLRCPVCGETIEKEITVLTAKKMKVHCLCRCRRTEIEARERRMMFEEEQMKVNRLKNLSLMDTKLADARLSSYLVTDINRKAFCAAKNYVENFPEMYRRNQGILFFGDVGTGKSYTAACIANELMERLQPVMMTSFVKLLSDADRFNGEISIFINRMNQVKFLVIDDLGAERGTDFALEIVYDIIDSRYRSRKPVILTTNLQIEQMKACSNIRYSRIYDRIFEMCYPVKLYGLSFRKKEAAARFAETKAVLEG